MSDAQGNRFQIALTATDYTPPAAAPSSPGNRLHRDQRRACHGVGHHQRSSVAANSALSTHAAPAATTNATTQAATPPARVIPPPRSTDDSSPGLGDSRGGQRGPRQTALQRPAVLEGKRRSWWAQRVGLGLEGRTQWEASYRRYFSGQPTDPKALMLGNGALLRRALTPTARRPPHFRTHRLRQRRRFPRRGRRRAGARDARAQVRQRQLRRRQVGPPAADRGQVQRIQGGFRARARAGAAEPDRQTHQPARPSPAGLLRQRPDHARGLAALGLERRLVPAHLPARSSTTYCASCRPSLRTTAAMRPASLATTSATNSPARWSIATTATWSSPRSRWPTRDQKAIACPRYLGAGVALQPACPATCTR